MQQLIVSIPALPIISAILIQVLSARLAQRVAWVSVAATGMTFALTVLMLGLELAGLSAHHFGTSFGWAVLFNDPLSAIMGVLIAGISLIVHLYSIRYMAEEPGYARFFVLLDLMTAALLVMVAAGDLVTLLVAWHIIGVLLYFLLGFDMRRQSPFRYAFWTFITYRIGDVALVVAAAILFHAYGTWSLADIVNAVIRAGLVIELLHEHDVCFYRQLPDMTQGPDGWWRLEKYGNKLPLTFSLRARRLL